MARSGGMHLLVLQTLNTFIHKYHFTSDGTSPFPHASFSIPPDSRQLYSFEMCQRSSLGRQVWKLRFMACEGAWLHILESAVCEKIAVESYDILPIWIMRTAMFSIRWLIILGGRPGRDFRPPNSCTTAKSEYALHKIAAGYNVVCTVSRNVGDSIGMWSVGLCEPTGNGRSLTGAAPSCFFCCWNTFIIASRRCYMCEPFFGCMNSQI